MRLASGKLPRFVATVHSRFQQIRECSCLVALTLFVIDKPEVQSRIHRMHQEIDMWAFIVISLFLHRFFISLVYLR